MESLKECVIYFRKLLKLEANNKMAVTNVRMALSNNTTSSTTHSIPSF